MIRSMASAHLIAVELPRDDEALDVAHLPQLDLGERREDGVLERPARHRRQDQSLGSSWAGAHVRPRSTV